MRTPTTPKHELLAKSMTHHLFQQFLNPDNQGSAFTWEKFPALAADLVESQVWMAYSKPPANFDAKKQAAVTAARRIAQELMAQHEGPLPVTAPAKKRTPTP